MKTSSIKKSIIVILGSYYPLETGFSLAFQYLQKALLQEKVIDEIFVLAPSDSEDPRIEGIHHIKLYKQTGLRAAKIACKMGFKDKIPLSFLSIKFNEMKKHIDVIIKRSNVQLILVESMFYSWTIPFLNKKYNIPSIVRIHGTGPEVTKYLKERITAYKKSLLKWTFDSKYVAATTSFYFDFFQDYWNDYDHFMNKYFLVIPNTADYQYAEPVTKDTLVLMQLGRMEEQGYHQKGFTDTIQALLYLEKKYEPKILKKIHYISIGSGTKEKEFTNLLGQLKFITHDHYSALKNSDVKELLKSSDVVLMPSRCEGMSMFATEALATGRAFIFTKGNGLKDIIIDGYNGIGVNCYDYLELADGLKQFIDNKDLAYKYGRNSRTLFEKEFSYQKVAQKFDVALSIIKGTSRN